MAMSFICDVCGREVNGITIVNGMNFCAKCYQETFVIPKPLSVQDLENCVKIECQQCKQKDQRIAELEKYNAQLEYWKSYWYNSYDEIRNKYNKNQQVKQERQKVIAELEEWVKKYQISVGDYVYITALNLNAKLCKMKAELEAKPQGKGEKDE